MSSFYGNIKNNMRSPFIFDRIYPSRKDMEDTLKKYQDENGQVQGDGVFINRYVLIDYGYAEAGTYVKIDPDNVQGNGEQLTSKHVVTADNYTEFYTYDPSTHEYSPATTYYSRDQLDNSWFYYKKVNFVDRYRTEASGRVENTWFADNREKDIKEYSADYHLTIWMKIYTDNVERYIQVGQLKAEAPAFELITDAPGETSPHFDLVQSSDINYVYHVPKNWDVRLNEHTEDHDLDGNERSIKYPYFNSDGFNELTTHRDGDIPAIGAVPAYNGADTTNQIKIKEYNLDGQKYPTHAFQRIDLTPNTYVPNQYYYYSGSATGDDIPEIITTTNDVEFTKNDEYSTTRVYYIKTQKISNSQLQTSIQNDSRQITIQIPAIGNAVSDLYDVLYGTNGNNQARPYSRQMLFEYHGIHPYDNLDDQDDISMGWGMEELKSYISELRYLSHGQNEGNLEIPSTEHPGLQSDWTLDDINAFGYIYHKPRILWSNPNLVDNNETVKTDSGSTPETDYYAMHSIEYIYDNYAASLTDLFGFDRNATTSMTRPTTTGEKAWLNLRV